jgi:hypothetical protein
MMAKLLRCTRFSGTLAVLFFASTLLYADGGRFDLTGPKIEVHVTRSGMTLPIAQVPNLQAGDKIWLHPDLPPTQSIHYLLVAVFLRGTTNPPPDNWFFRIETWNKKVQQEGVEVTVPNEAQQVILFLAPETGGDYTTLRSAVKGRPGTFVRASQDLNEAGFEQARIEKYIASMRLVPPGDPKAIAEHSSLLSTTLALKPNQECFKQPIELQSTCLTQTGTQTLMDDGHGQTVVDSLTSGANSDFINQASYTQAFGAGVYSAYVGAIVDLIRITSSLHTAKYQYIPAIAFPEAESLNLRLNVPPSFHDPKSVIVIGLPAIQAAVPPPLRPSDPNQVSCLLKPALVLAVEGAPLVYSTSFAHDLVLHFDGPDAPRDIPLTPDAFQGGLIIDQLPTRKLLTDDANDSHGHTALKPSQRPSDAAPPPSQPSVAIHSGTNTITGTINGYWGFDAFKGPALQLQNTPGKDWKLAGADVLIAGRENQLTLSSTGTACIKDITLDTATGKRAQTKWKTSAEPTAVDVTVSLKSIDPGALHLAVHQFGAPISDTVAAETYSEPAALTTLELHAGDTTADLTGTSLDQVQKLTINDLTYTPAPPSTPANQDTATPTPAPVDPSTNLRLTLPSNSQAPKFRSGEKLVARFTLKDGRTLTLPVTVSPSRPSVTILNKSIAQDGGSPIHLADQDDLPVNQQLTFSLKSAANFARTGQLEIANADESLHTMLNVANGGLILQNPHTLLATLDPLKTFGTSAFGPLRLRPVSPDGTTGDWLSLVTLVRLPTLTELHCPAETNLPCTVNGTGLYLVDSIATDASFTTPTIVPEGFIGTTLSLPRPARTGFFLRLRDDPNSANVVILPILPQPTTTNSPTASITKGQPRN